MWVYDDLPKLQLDLLEQRIIALSGEMNGKTLTQVREAFLRLEAAGSPDVEIRISSGGGFYRTAIGVYDLIRLYKGETRGVVHMHCESMAAVVLQACTKRAIAQNAWLLLHHLKIQDSVTLDDFRRPAKIKAMRKETELWQKNIYEIFAKKSGRSIEEINRICKKNRRIYAKKALKLGLVDEII